MLTHKGPARTPTRKRQNKFSRAKDVEQTLKCKYPKFKYPTRGAFGTQSHAIWVELRTQPRTHMSRSMTMYGVHRVQ
eukprot:8627654-Pyramimonas_sp.AAC.3